jgi:hypothetical protein
MLFLSTEDGGCVILSFDWLHLDGRWVKKLKGAIGDALGISPERVIATATHTHSGPGVFGIDWEGKGEKKADEDAYLQKVFLNVMEGVASLAESEQPVTLSVGEATLSGFGKNRNDPQSPVDEGLVSLVLRGVDGAVVDRLVNYGCHPTVLGPENRSFSADFVGVGLDAVDARRGGLSLFLNGGAGDVSSRFTRIGRGYPERDRFASLFRDAIIRAEKNVKNVDAKDIVVQNVRVPVEPEELPGEEESEALIAAAETEIDHAKEEGLSAHEIRKRESVREGALARLMISKLGGRETLMGEKEMVAGITFLKMGGIGIIFLPGEIMSETASLLKEESPIPLLVGGYADDYFGYLVPDDASHSNTYESLVTFLSGDSVNRIIEAARRLVSESTS